MGSFVVNEIISPETNLFFAFIIGIAFGFVPEINGFSSSRPLAGMFYSYDTTVMIELHTSGWLKLLGRNQYES